MEKNDIKKALYKQKPLAQLQSINKDGIWYMVMIEVKDTIIDYETIYFKIPFIDIGDATFNISMDAKLLIRYIV